MLCSFQNDTKPQIIKKAHDYFTVDNLGNVFFIKENEMVKHLANGNYFNRYSNLKLGNITSVDATNALRIMLFYKDYQQLVFVDNQLTQKKRSCFIGKNWDTNKQNLLAFRQIMEFGYSTRLIMNWYDLMSN
ncbi:MAG: hypothetical protein IPJ60_02495 [Sphingobacteriaceae bacterium]|nr:hypothetical protein [Sphingobacteriaceae bacterium]